MNSLGKSTITTLEVAEMMEFTFKNETKKEQTQ